MIDLHYWPRPNGKKVTILLEELGTPYNIVPCNIGKGDQINPDFLKIAPIIACRRWWIMRRLTAGRRSASSSPVQS
jgi:hypothetical protein